MKKRKLKRKRNPKSLHHRAHYAGGVLAHENDRAYLRHDYGTRSTSGALELKKGEPVFITVIPTGAGDDATVYVQAINRPEIHPVPVALSALIPLLGKKGWPKRTEGDRFDRYRKAMETIDANRPKKNPRASMIPKSVRALALKHQVSVGRDSEGNYTIHDHATGHVVEMTRSAKPTVPQAKAMIRRYLKHGAAFRTSNPKARGFVICLTVKGTKKKLCYCDKTRLRAAKDSGPARFCDDIAPTVYPSKEGARRHAMGLLQWPAISRHRVTVEPYRPKA